MKFQKYNKLIYVKQPFLLPPGEYVKLLEGVWGMEIVSENSFYLTLINLSCFNNTF